MRRSWILAAAGAVLVGTATILGLILFRKYGIFELTLPELTIWLFVVGPMTVAFLGLLFVEMKGPSVMRRTRFFLFGLFGAMCGLIASVVYGVFGIKEAALRRRRYRYRLLRVVGTGTGAGLVLALPRSVGSSRRHPGSRGRRDRCLAHPR
jgi:hypothetical protein